MVGPGSNAPIQTPFKQGRGMIQRKRFEKQSSIDVKKHLRLYPPPMVRWAGNAKMKIYKGISGDHREMLIKNPEDFEKLLFLAFDVDNKGPDVQTKTIVTTS